MRIGVSYANVYSNVCTIGHRVADKGVEVSEIAGDRPDACKIGN